MKKVIIIVVIVLGLGTAAAYRIYQLKSQPVVQGIEEQQKKEGTPVRVFAVQAEDLKKTVSVSGSIEAYQSVAIAPQLAERIETIHVKTGQKVAKDDLLVTLDTTNAKLAVAQAQASLDQAKEQLRKLENGSRPEEITAAQAVVDEAAALLKLQKLEVERYQGLYKEQAATLQQLQTVENQYKRMQAGLVAAQAQYELMKKGPREEDIAIAKTQVALAQVARDQAQDRLEDHYLQAPFEGVMTVRQFEPGALVDFNQPIFSLLQIDPVYLVLKVSELYLSHIQEGMSVNVTIDALPDQKFTGRVAEINPVTETTIRSFRTKILLENPQEKIKPGMFARAEIVVEHITQAITVPADGLRKEAKQAYVLIVDAQKKARRRDVKIGAAYGEKVQILSGIQAAEQVITLAPDSVKAGSKLVVEEVK
jgi:HlyD family secretion protein